LPKYLVNKEPNFDSAASPRYQNLVPYFTAQALLRIT